MMCGRLKARLDKKIVADFVSRLDDPRGEIRNSAIKMLNGVGLKLDNRQIYNIFEIDPERFEVIVNGGVRDPEKNVPKLIERGLRAQLVTQSQVSSLRSQLE